MAGQAGTTGQGLKNSPHDDPDRGNEGKSQLDMKRQNWQARSLSTLQLVAFLYQQPILRIYSICGICIDMLRFREAHNI